VGRHLALHEPADRLAEDLVLLREQRALDHGVSFRP
jgi:hypothetical protein